MSDTCRLIAHTHCSLLLFFFFFFKLYDIIFIFNVEQIFLGELFRMWNIMHLCLVKFQECHNKSSALIKCNSAMQVLCFDNKIMNIAL